MKKIIPFAVILSAVFYQSSMAQHPAHHQMKDSLHEKADTSKMKPVKKEPMQHDMHAMHTMAAMPTHAYSRNLPMSRNGSGTGWNPDASPMYMWLKQGQKADWMFHGNIFLRYTGTDVFNKGEKGSSKLSAPNWFMAMMNRKTGRKGLLNFTAMLSLDRLTEGGNGYPLLFQSGET